MALTATTKSTFKNPEEFSFQNHSLYPALVIILRFYQYRPDDMCERFLAGRGKLQAKPLQTQLLMDLVRSLQPSARGYQIFGLKVPYLDLAVRNQF